MHVLLTLQVVEAIAVGGPHENHHRERATLSVLKHARSQSPRLFQPQHVAQKRVHIEHNVELPGDMPHIDLKKDLKKLEGGIKEKFGESKKRDVMMGVRKVLARRTAVLSRSPVSAAGVDQFSLAHLRHDGNIACSSLLP